MCYLRDRVEAAGMKGMAAQRGGAAARPAAPPGAVPPHGLGRVEAAAGREAAVAAHQGSEGRRGRRQSRGAGARAAGRGGPRAARRREALSVLTLHLCLGTAPVISGLGISTRSTAGVPLVRAVGSSPAAAAWPGCAARRPRPAARRRQSQPAHDPDRSPPPPAGTARRRCGCPRRNARRNSAGGAQALARGRSRAPAPRRPAVRPRSACAPSGAAA